MNNLLVLSAISFLRHCKIRMKKSRFQLFPCFSLALVATRARYGDKLGPPPPNLSPQGIDILQRHNKIPRRNCDGGYIIPFQSCPPVRES